ncbi:MAG: flavin monoamine oxidase family protein [Bacteroidota bacterium]
MTRREFVDQGARLGISAYAALFAWGFLPPAPAQAFAPVPGEKRKKILILGAGLAGLASAYELSKLGYECQILEAQERAGGRVWTVREGSKVEEIDGSTQRAQFDQGLYLNAGAARIPHHHELSVHYCRELGVDLEVFVNMNEAAFAYAESQGKGTRLRLRELNADLRGHTSELLAKAIHSEALDQEISTEDAAQLLEYLRTEGDLRSTFTYTGTERRGYEFANGASEAFAPSQPQNLSQLIQQGFLHPAFAHVAEYTYHQQPTLLQPVGGMDRIVKAFLEKVGKQIEYQAQVLEIRNTNGGVQVRYQKAKKQEKILEADLCICTLPLPVLKGIKNNLGGDIQRACDFLPYLKTGKIALQFKRRFWEEDEGIFGGISKTNMDITQIFYPSYGFLGKKGILKGYYNFHERAEKFADLSPAEREAKALSEGEKIHPQYRKEFESSFSIAWHKIPFSQGGWANYSGTQRKRLFPALLRPDGAIYFAGEHTTYLNAWMAGAFESARRVVEQIHQRVQKD